MNIFNAAVNSVFIALVILIVSFSSCDPTVSSPPPQNVKAGIYDESYHYQVYVTPKEIQVAWDSINLYGVGVDSIDVDLDGTFDLQFDLNIINPDSLHLLNGTPQPFPSLCVNSINNVELAGFIEVVPVGLGTTVEVQWVDTLSFEELVNIEVKWLEPQQCAMNIWGENPKPGLFGFGGWYTLNATKYIGVRMNSKYGWIELDTTDPYHPKFLSYAIQK